MRTLLAGLVVVFAAVPAHADSTKVTLGATTGSGATAKYRTAVTAKLKRSYLGGIKSCYKAALKKRPDLAGKLSVGFTVDKKGATSLLTAGFDPTIDPCILKAAKSWKFGVPKDDAKAAVEATFSIEVTLTPPDPNEERAAAIATLLVGEPSGAPRDDMAKRRPGADLDLQINDVKDSGSTVTVGGGVGGSVRQGSRSGDATGSRGGGVITGPGSPGSDKGSDQDSDKGPAGRISIIDKQAFDTTDLSVETVLKKIQSAYMSGLKRCYKTRLKVDPTLRGKLSLSLTVKETGRTVSATARGFDPELDKCVTAMMGNWVFPIPKDDDREPTEASFQIMLALVPD